MNEPLARAALGLACTASAAPTAALASTAAAPAAQTAAPAGGGR